MIFNHYFLIQSLLDVGLTYTEIFELEEAQIVYLLATNHAIGDKRRDAQDAQQRASESIQQQQNKYTAKRR